MDIARLVNPATPPHQTLPLPDPRPPEPSTATGGNPSTLPRARTVARHNLQERGPKESKERDGESMRR